MTKVWKVLALLLIITVLVWLTTMWRWQSAQIDPSGTDVVLHLAVLPLALTTALLAFVWLVSRLRKYAAAPVAPKRTLAVAVPGDKAVAEAVFNERTASFLILGSAVLTKAGTDRQAAAASLAEGSCKPELDTELKDDNGLAVFTARIPDLNIDEVSSAAAELVALQRAAPGSSEWAEFETPPQVLRALALMEQTVDNLVETLRLQWPALATKAVARSKPGVPVAAAAPLASIRVAIPARWSTLSQQVARRWIEQKLEPVIAEGLHAAGQSPAMARSAQAAVQLHIHPVPHADAFWSLTDQQLLQWERSKQAGLLMALASDSWLGDDDVVKMAEGKELFSGANERGRVPGEAAAALLLASSAWSAPADAPTPKARLHRASQMHRDKSADAAGRVSSQALTHAVSDTLAGTGYPADLIECLTCDADQRGSRQGEVHETMQHELVHLDPNEHALSIGVGCGDLGVASLLACAALSISQVEESRKPLLVLGAFSSFERFAVVMTPATMSPPAAAVPTPAA